MKLLLYCTKSKPYLRDYRGKAIYDKFILPFHLINDDTQPILNGKIVAECDFEVEEIKRNRYYHSTEDYDYVWDTKTLTYDELLEKSCLNNNQLEDYLEFDGYAIHIKNLNIFDEPKELSEYIRKDEFMGGKQVFWETIKKAPQNMMYAYDKKDDYILISIQPQWLCKILNGEKTIEVRKKVLKGLLR